MKDSAPILFIRNKPVILDADLATLYGVTTKRLNEQVKRNRERFPADFRFRLNNGEKKELVANCDHLQRLKFSKTLPLAFTEHGALMAATVLKTPQAIKMSLFIVRAFVKQRQALSRNQAILKHLAMIDKSLLLQDTALKNLYQKLLPLLAPPPSKPKRPIGFG